MSLAAQSGQNFQNPSSQIGRNLEALGSSQKDQCREMRAIKDGQECSIQKPPLYTCPHTEKKKNIFKVTEDGQFKFPPVVIWTHCQEYIVTRPYCTEKSGIQDI